MPTPNRAEITWVEKDEHADPIGRITRIGGSYFSLSVATAIGEVVSGQWQFFVTWDGTEFDLTVAESADGRQYLKSMADGDIPSTLLILPAWAPTTQRKPSIP